MDLTVNFTVVISMSLSMFHTVLVTIHLKLCVTVLITTFATLLVTVPIIVYVEIGDAPLTLIEVTVISIQMSLVTIVLSLFLIIRVLVASFYRGARSQFFMLVLFFHPNYLALRPRLRSDVTSEYNTV